MGLEQKAVGTKGINKKGCGGDDDSSTPAEPYTPPVIAPITETPMSTPYVFRIEIASQIFLTYSLSGAGRVAGIGHYIFINSPYNNSGVNVGYYNNFADTLNYLQNYLRVWYLGVRYCDYNSRINSGNMGQWDIPYASPQKYNVRFAIELSAAGGIYTPLITIQSQAYIVYATKNASQVGLKSSVFTEFPLVNTALQVQHLSMFSQGGTDYEPTVSFYMGYQSYPPSTFTFLGGITANELFKRSLDTTDSVWCSACPIPTP